MRTVIRSIFTAATTLFSAVAFAQSSCEKFQDAIEHQIKATSLSKGSILLEDNDSKLTLHNLEIANSLATIQLNLTLMAQKNCPARTDPIDPAVYIGSAVACSQALRRGEKSSPLCDFSEWKAIKSQR